MEKQFYTVKELAQMLGVSELWLWRRVRKQEIPSYKFGKKRLFKKDEINKWIESHKDTGTN